MLSPQATEILARCVLVLLGLGLAAYATALIRRLPLDLGLSLLYGLNYVLARILWRAEVSDQLPVSPDQGAVIVSNHRSPTDPGLVFLTTNRLVHWMVAREYCQHPALAWFFRQIEAIPVGRAGIDTAATKMAIRYLESGKLVGLFLEGRLNDTDQLMLPGRPGAALIALKARARVVPCYVSGSPYRGRVVTSVFLPAKARLRLGPPLDLSPYFGRENEREVLDQVTRLFLVEIARLAGQPDYEPRLAGRGWGKAEKTRR